MVQQKLEEMRECWGHLESTTKAKARQLFETQNHRTPGTNPSAKALPDLDQQLSLLQEQPPTVGSASPSATAASLATMPTLLQPRPTFSQQLQRIQVGHKAVIHLTLNRGDM